MSGKYECALYLPGPDGANVELVAVDVQGEFIGLSLTERKGLNMRRVGAELHDVEQVRSLRDTLSAFLDRVSPEHP